MHDKGLVLIALSIAMVMACVGVGYAVEYSASTDNSNNPIETNYIILELKDNGFTSQNTFVFDDIVYYRDRVVIGNTVTDTFKCATGQSDMVKVYLRHTPSTDEVETVMSVKLNQSLGTIQVEETGNSEPVMVNIPIATLVLQFYWDDPEDGTDDWVEYGNPINMSTIAQYVTVGDGPEAGYAIFNIDTEYMCQATITLNGEYLNQLNSDSGSGLGDGSGQIEFAMTFSATTND